jgi:hypothetical protein
VTASCHARAWGNVAFRHSRRRGHVYCQDTCLGHREVEHVSFTPSVGMAPGSGTVDMAFPSSNVTLQFAELVLSAPLEYHCAWDRR